MKKYKFITIKPMDDNIRPADPTEETYLIFNNKQIEQYYDIGIIRWHRPWREWVFETDPSSIWSVSCLRDIIDFIENEIPKARPHER